METDVMFIGAHPDDVEIGAGGVVAALTAAGKSVVLVDLTNGEPTPYGTPERREQEARAAAEILGVKERVLLGLTNREVMDDVASRRRLAAIIRQFRPKILCAHYADDAHPDHIQANALSIGARFYAKLTKADLPHEPYLPRKMFYFFSLHLRAKIQPSFIYDVSPYLEQKKRALEAYRSQFIENPINRGVVEGIVQDNSYWGAQIRSAFGEPFACDEHIRLVNTSAFLDA